jgi:hypothetical protein
MPYPLPITMTTLEARLQSRIQLFSAMGGGKGGGAQRAVLQVYKLRMTGARSAANTH